MTQEREAFEAAYSAAYPWTVENTPDCFEQTASGNYEITGVMVGWRMWQARASLAQPASVPAPLPAPEYSHCDADYSVGHGVGYVQGWNACIEATLAAAPQAPQPAQAEPIAALVDESERLGLYDVPPLADLREKLGGWDVPEVSGKQAEQGGK